MEENSKHINSKLLQYDFYELINSESKDEKSMYVNNDSYQVIQDSKEIEGYLEQDIDSKKTFIFLKPLSFQLLLEIRNNLKHNKYYENRDSLNIQNPHYSICYTSALNQMYIQFKTLFENDIEIVWSDQAFQLTVHVSWNQIDKLYKENNESCLDRIFKLLSLMKEVYDCEIKFFIQLTQSKNWEFEQNQSQLIKKYQKNTFKFRTTTVQNIPQDEQDEQDEQEHSFQDLKKQFQFKYQESFNCKFKITRYSQNWARFNGGWKKDKQISKNSIDNSTLGNLKFVGPLLTSLIKIAKSYYDTYLQEMLKQIHLRKVVQNMDVIQKDGVCWDLFL